MSLVDNFRSNLRQAMKERGISQVALAKAADVRIATVCDIFAGRMEPSVEMCEKLAKAAGLRPDASFLLPEAKAS